VFDVAHDRLAHANPDKCAEYQKGSKDLFLAGVVFNEFTRALTYLLTAFRLVRELNEKVLSRGNTGTAP
jgi:hypothetical protein